MSKKTIADHITTERENFIETFRGFRNILEHDWQHGINEERAPRLTILYKYEKGKNYFLFISVKRNYSEEITDVATQMLIIPRKHEIKMVGRNEYFDAQDEFGNIVHLEMDTSSDPSEIMSQILMFKK
jgi:hypothetical protein